LEVSGALAQKLVPDETALAVRVRAALDSLDDSELPDAEREPKACRKSSLRGLEAQKRTTLEVLRMALKRQRGTLAKKLPHRTVLLLLDANGMPVEQVCQQVRRGPNLTGVVIVVGDHRGYSEEFMSNCSEVATSVGAEVLHVSLGGTTLLASHAIVILHHYLDEHLHRCQLPEE